MNGGDTKTSWHLKIFSALWAYRTSVKTATGFTPFQLVYELEEVLPIECEISSLKLAIKLLPSTTNEEERFLCLNQLEEFRRDAYFANETHKKHVKSQYDRNVQPHSFEHGNMVLTYNQR